MRWLGGVVIALGGCDGGEAAEDTDVDVADGGCDVCVTREGRGTEEHRDVRFACEVDPPDPPNGFVGLACVHGDPDAGDGLRVLVIVPEDVTGRPAGTSFVQGTDLEVYGIEGSLDGSIWGASGWSTWWAGELTLTLRERDADGLGATFSGTTATTPEVVDLIPITVVFDDAEVRLP